MDCLVMEKKEKEDLQLIFDVVGIVPQSSN